MTKLSFKFAGPAMSEMDWSKLKTHLDDVGLTLESHLKIMSWLRRAQPIIQSRKNKMSNKRDNFLISYEEYVGTHLNDKSAEDVTRLQQEISIIELGYEQILEDRANGPFGPLTSTERIAAILSRVCRSVDEMINIRDRHVERTGSVSTSSIIEDDIGQRVDLDGVNAALVEAAGMTLLIEAHGQKWFHDSGRMILPEFEFDSDINDFDLEMGLMNAMSWRRWKRAEELHRFLDGELIHVDDKDIIATLPHTVKQLVSFEQADSTIELLDEVANDRIKHGMTQNFFEMKQQTNIGQLSSGLGKAIGIGRGQFISEAESHAAVALSSTMSAAIIDDLDEYSGLRLTEWLRGYAILQQYAIDSFEEAGADKLLPKLTNQKLVELLQKFGLSENKATIFIEKTTFGKSSRDLFDHPLIETDKGHLILFGPALLHGNLTGMLLSTLSNLKEDLQKKGHAFEAHMVKLLNSYDGITAKTVRVKRDGEEYDYDVLALWGDYIFHFECKTHGLSGGTPQRIYRFHQEARKDAKQTQRLSDALVKFPDILEEAFGEASKGKEAVSCVLNALPYAVPGGINGIPFFDASALGRFFEERYLHIKTWHRGAKVDLMHRVAIKDLWLADEPTPERLIDEINDPVQVKMDIAHIDVQPLGLVFSTELAAFIYDYVSLPMSDQSLADVFNVDVDSIREQQSEVLEAYTKLREHSKHI